MKDKGVLQDVVFLLAKIAIFAGIIFVMFGFIFGIQRVTGMEMAPAFKDGDLAVYYRLQETYHPNDAVVMERDGEKSVRRIIAMTGDVVDITADGLMINGYIQQEPNIYTETLPFKDGIKFPLTLQEDEYFVLGDDRTSAKDSRIYGVIHRKDIKGLVMTLIRRRGF